VSECKHSVETVMENLAVGDQLTITDKYGVERTHEIKFFQKNGREAQFGLHEDGPWIIDVQEATFHEVDADGPLGIGADIVDVLYWDGNLEDTGGDGGD